MTFCVVEGLDGAGKTSVVEAITEHFTEQGDTVVTTKEPTERAFGQQVRDRLAQPESDPLIDFFLFMADRWDHITNVIQPADERVSLVVSDRYADSTRAYQPVAMTGAGTPFVDQLDAKAFIETVMQSWNYEPALTLYIDISVDTAIERAAGDEKYEDRVFLAQVRENYETVMEYQAGNRVRIDGDQPVDAVAADAIAAIEDVHE
jgi:dTMP kinase